MDPLLESVKDTALVINANVSQAQFFSPTIKTLGVGVRWTASIHCTFQSVRKSPVRDGGRSVPIDTISKKLSELARRHSHTRTLSTKLGSVKHHRILPPVRSE